VKDGVSFVNQVSNISLDHPLPLLIEGLDQDTQPERNGSLRALLGLLDCCLDSDVELDKLEQLIEVLNCIAVPLNSKQECLMKRRRSRIVGHSLEKSEAVEVRPQEFW